MSLALRIVIDVCIFVGAFFALAGTIGVIRMPDTYCRMQASTCIATMGVIGVAIGTLLYAICVEKNAAMAVKIGVVMAFVLFTNPISGHALCKGAYRRGLRPKRPMVIDDFKEDDPYDE
ncbi:MAG: monovalent cation/H(+) antiporter subunit G [Eubacteriales bacterium]|nr:monovalent cation/H(+) antiporter subunit G [Eubacteriales bacterium]